MRKNELICLGLIYSKPNYAYVIDNAIKVYKMDEWVNLSRSSLYNTLGKLVKDEYVELSIEKIGNMPDRKVYSITDKGRDKLRSEVIKIMNTINPAENLFYLAQGFLFDIDAQEAERILEDRKMKFRERIELFKKEYESAWDNGIYHIALQCKAAMKHGQTELELIDDLIQIYHEHPEYFSEGLKRFYNEIVFSDKDGK